VAAHRGVASDPRRGADAGPRGGWAGAHAQCRDPRQPKREDDGKGGPRGFDAGKKVNGRKRHLAVDTLGFLLVVVVHPANVQDRDGGKYVIVHLAAPGAFPRLAHLWVDGAYAGQLVAWVAAYAGWTAEVVSRPEGAKGFLLLPRRWVVERTLAWLGRCRRLSKDYEALPDSEEALIHLAMTHVMLRRLRPH
jgi:putative transposase